MAINTPQLYGLKDLVRYTGLHYQLLKTSMAYRDFPKPVASRKHGRWHCHAWNVSEVREWLNANPRKDKTIKGT